MKGRLRTQMMNVTLKEEDYKKKSKFESNFAFKKRLTDPRFGEISIVQNPKTRQLLAVRERKINDKKTAGQQIVNCKNRLGHKHPNLLNLLDYSVTKQSELCSSHYIIKEFFEYPRSDLSREIQMKEREGETMDHKDLTHILYQQIAVNSYLQNKDMSHGDVQPINITWDKNNKQSKLIDKSTDSMDPRGAMQIQKNRFVSGHKLYQSPTLYSKLKKGNLKSDHNRSKEDTFALGLSILEAGNGKSVQNIYNKGKGEVDQQKLNEHVREFENKYGQQNTLLCSTVASMVDPDEANRPDFKSLEAQIPNYDDVKKYLDNDDGSFNQQNHGGNFNQQNQGGQYNDVPYDYNNGYNQNQYNVQNEPENDSNDLWNNTEVKNADQYTGIKQVDGFEPQPFAQVQTPHVQNVPRRSLNNSTYSNQEMNDYDHSPFIKKNNNVMVNASNNVPPQTNNQVENNNLSDHNESPYIQQSIPQLPVQQSDPYVSKHNQSYNTSTQLNTTHNTQLNTTHNTTNSRVYFDHASNYPKLQYAPQPEYRQTYVSVSDQQKPGYTTHSTYSDRYVSNQPVQQHVTYTSQRNTQVYQQPHTITESTYQTQPRVSTVYHTTTTQQQERPMQTTYSNGNNQVVRTTVVQNNQPYTEQRRSTQVIQSQGTLPYTTQNQAQTRVVYTQNDHVSGDAQVQGGLKLVRTYEDPSHAYKKN